MQPRQKNQHQRPRQPQNNVPASQPQERDRIARLKVNEGQEGTLLELLFNAFPERKRTDIRRWVANGQVAVDGTAAAHGDTPVNPGQEVSVNFSRSFGGLRDPRVQIVYEDDDFVVVNKAAGLLSVAADNQRRRAQENASQETAYSIVRGYVKRQNPHNDLFILHRLDRDTSGLLAFAKRQNIQEALRANWNNMVAQRQYVAVLSGTLAPAEGTVKSYLVEDANYDVRSTDRPGEGKLAITQYKTLATGNGLTLAEFNLATGRKNQIRVHMKEKGCPVVGDSRYGTKASPLGRLCLHAQCLKLVHPLTRRMMQFTARAPAAFADLVK